MAVGNFALITTHSMQLHTIILLIYAYPFPRIDSALDSLKGAAYFTTLDLAYGYWQVAMAENDKEKTAFSTPQGYFEFNVMLFGLTNASAIFQWLMECVMTGLSGEECLIYPD